MAGNRPFSVLLWRAILVGGILLGIAYSLPETSFSKNQDELPEGFTVVDIWAGVVAVVGVAAAVVLTMLAAAQLTLETRRPNLGAALLLGVGSLGSAGIWGATAKLVRPLLADSPGLWDAAWLGLSGVLVLAAVLVLALVRVRAPSAEYADDKKEPLAIAGQPLSPAFCSECGTLLVNGRCERCAKLLASPQMTDWE